MSLLGGLGIGSTPSVKVLSSGVVVVYKDIDSEPPALCRQKGMETGNGKEKLKRKISAVLKRQKWNGEEKNKNKNSLKNKTKPHWVLFSSVQNEVTFTVMYLMALENTTDEIVCLFLVSYGSTALASGLVTSWSCHRVNGVVGLGTWWQCCCSGWTSPVPHVHLGKVGMAGLFPSW